MIVTHTRAKNLGQKIRVVSVCGLQARVERDGRTDMTDCITFPANAVGNIKRTNSVICLEAVRVYTEHDVKLGAWQTIA